MGKDIWGMMGQMQTKEKQEWGKYVEIAELKVKDTWNSSSQGKIQ